MFQTFTALDVIAKFVTAVEIAIKVDIVVL